MRLSILFALISLTFSCSERKGELEGEKGRINTIVITDIHKKKVTHPNIEIVHLKSNPHKEIGLIIKVIHLEDRYIIGDQLKGNAVFIYDLWGNYINHIHRVGQGPGEYRNIENIYFKEITNELILYPMDELKKMFFDIKGNYLREEFMDHSLRFADLVYFGHDELVAHHAHLDGGHNLVLLSDNEVVDQNFPFDETFDDFRFNKLNVLARENRDEILLSMGIRDKLYVYNSLEKTVTTKYIIDFNKRRIDVDHFELGKKVVGEEEKYVGLFNIFQNENILSFSTFTQDDIVIFFYDKLKNKLYSGKQVLRDIVANAQVRFIVGMTNDGRFIGVIEPDKAEPLDFKNHKKLQKTYDGFNISDPDDKLLLIFDFEPK